MSYEHCDIHDCDATNGCPICEALADETEARDAVEPLVAQFADKFDRWASMNDYSAHLSEPTERLFQELALAAYKLGKGPREP